MEGTIGWVMEMAHQNGRWKITSRSGGLCRIGTDTIETIAVVGGRGQKAADLLAKRIIACVNACAGRDTRDLERHMKKQDRLRAKKK